MVVAVQECSRMNILLFELKRSLLELVKGMDGQLNMTQAMEDLQTALAKNEVRTYRMFARFRVSPGQKYICADAFESLIC